MKERNSCLLLVHTSFSLQRSICAVALFPVLSLSVIIERITFAQGLEKSDETMHCWPPLGLKGTQIMTMTHVISGGFTLVYAYLNRFQRVNTKVNRLLENVQVATNFMLKRII